MLAFIEVELPNPKALSKIRNYFQKWRPMRTALPAGELEALGVPRGPQFDKILEQLFEMQLRGRGRNSGGSHQDSAQLAGIKEEPKKKPEKPKKKGKGGAAEPPAQQAVTKPSEKAGHPQDRSRSSFKCPALTCDSCAFSRRGYWREGASEA